MSIKVGITGGIGTGKSFVSKIFIAMGIPFYDADFEAKQIMVTNEGVQQKLVASFGKEVYHEDGALNRKWLSDQVFGNQAKLDILNAIVHPAVIQAGIDWFAQQTAAYSLKEAALLYESGSYKSLDLTILVTAPTELRIQRVMERDKVSRDEVLNRIGKQMPEEEKLRFADYVIVNDEVQALVPQIITIHQQILQRNV